MHILKQLHFPLTGISWSNKKAESRTKASDECHTQWELHYPSRQRVGRTVLCLKKMSDGDTRQERALYTCSIIEPGTSILATQVHMYIRIRLNQISRICSISREQKKMKAISKKKKPKYHYFSNIPTANMIMTPAIGIVPSAFQMSNSCSDKSKSINCNRKENEKNLH